MQKRAQKSAMTERSMQGSAPHPGGSSQPAVGVKRLDSLIEEKARCLARAVEIEGEVAEIANELLERSRELLERSGDIGRAEPKKAPPKLRLVPKPEPVKPNPPENLAFDFPLPDGEQWTEDEVDIVHEKMLKHALRIIVDGRACPATRKEWWVWIIDDIDGLFTFTECCRRENADPDQLRDSLLSLTNRKLPEFHPRTLLN